MAHLHAGVECEHATKKACLAAQRDVMGRCTSLTQADKTGQTSCGNWAVAEVNGRKVCGQHYASTLERERREVRAKAKADALDARIDSYLAWTATHPSVWDRRINAG